MAEPASTAVRSEEPESPAGMARQPGERWSRFAARIGSAFGLVLLLVLATYVTTSLTNPARGASSVVIAALASISAVVGLVTAEARPVIVRWAMRLAGVSIVLALIGALTDTPWLTGTSSLIETLLLAIAAAAVLGAVVTEEEVGFRTILGAISVYIILALLFTFVYVAIDRLQPGPFFGNAKPGRGDYVFFSLTTLTTTGYGNLVPAAQPGKVVAGLEMLMGQVFLVTLIARLVSLWQPGQWARLRQRRGG